MGGIGGPDTHCAHDKCPMGVISFGLGGIIVSNPLGVDRVCQGDATEANIKVSNGVGILASPRGSVWESLDGPMGKGKISLSCGILAGPKDMVKGGHKGWHLILLLGCRHLPLDFAKISLVGSLWVGPTLSWVGPSRSPRAHLGHSA